MPEKITALLASPRRGGNSEILLKTALRGVPARRTKLIRVCGLRIAPCVSCDYCRSAGECRIKDDFQKVARYLRSADTLLVSSPIYFYGLPSQFKALIDRSQSEWCGKYILKQKRARRCAGHPRRKTARTILVGATRGEKLFDGSLLTLRYFYDAWGFESAGGLLVKGVDEKGEIKSRPAALASSSRLLAKKSAARSPRGEFYENL